MAEYPERYVFLFTFFLISVLSQAQVYEFPIRPGTTEWDKLRTEKDRFSAMLIPDDQLKHMSTIDLLITCMNYPAYGYFTAFNDPQEGIDINIRNFNGLQELMRRTDAPNELLSIYKQMDTFKMTLKNKAIETNLFGQLKGLISNCY